MQLKLSWNTSKSTGMEKNIAEMQTFRLKCICITAHQGSFVSLDRSLQAFQRFQANIIWNFSINARGRNKRLAKTRYSADKNFEINHKYAYPAVKHWSPEIFTQK